MPRNWSNQLYPKASDYSSIEVFLLVANFMLEVAKDDSVSLSNLSTPDVSAPQITEVEL